MLLPPISLSEHPNFRLIRPEHQPVPPLSTDIRNPSKDAAASATPPSSSLHRCFRCLRQHRRRLFCRDVTMGCAIAMRCRSHAKMSRIERGVFGRDVTSANKKVMALVTLAGLSCGVVTGYCQVQGYNPVFLQIPYHTGMITTGPRPIG